MRAGDRQTLASTSHDESVTLWDLALLHDEDGNDGAELPADAEQVSNPLSARAASLSPCCTLSWSVRSARCQGCQCEERFLSSKD